MFTLSANNIIHTHTTCITRVHTLWIWLKQLHYNEIIFTYLQSKYQSPIKKLVLALLILTGCTNFTSKITKSSRGIRMTSSRAVSQLPFSSFTASLLCKQMGSWLSGRVHCTFYTTLTPWKILLSSRPVTWKHNNILGSKIPIWFKFEVWFNLPLPLQALGRIKGYLFVIDNLC